MNIPASNKARRSKVITRLFFDRGRVIAALSLGKGPAVVVEVFASFCSPLALGEGKAAGVSVSVSSRASATFGVLLLLSVLGAVLSWGDMLSTAGIVWLVMLAVGVPSSTGGGTTCEVPSSVSISDIDYLPK